MRYLATLAPMAPPRLYCPVPLVTGLLVDLPEGVARHAAGALRLARGEAVVLFNGEGGEHEAEIVAIGRGGVSVRLGAHHAVEREPALEVTLAQALLPADKMDWVVQKSVELGVARIQPLESGRSVARLDRARAEKRLAHWRAVVAAACEQCGRNRLPEVQPVARLGPWLASQRDGAVTRFLLVLAAERSLSSLGVSSGPFSLLVGPEGGFAPAEQAAALAAGFAPVRLGPRVLRAETAGLAALAALAALGGEF
jgi:16S rRNA (uracil1498-N3)-methyltransferase